MSDRLTGWLLDVYPNGTNLSLWVIGQDGNRYHLQQDFSARVYAAGPAARLRRLWTWLTAQPIPVRLERTTRRDVFHGPLTLLAVEVLQPSRLDELFRNMSTAFEDLTYYDADISLPLRHAAAFDVFPLALCRFELTGDQVTNITPLDTPWEIDPPAPPLRILTLETDCDPGHGQPQSVILSHDRVRTSLPLAETRALLVCLAAELHHYNPDILLTSWGDTWLLPWLLEASRQTSLPLPLNRDENQPVVERKEHTYFSYGQIIYRGRQVHLRGRWHLDRRNAILWNDYGLQGALEMARVTRQPAQEAARLSPGTGISSMQFVTALQHNLLIPWHKHQAETPKTAMDLLHADMGGMVYQPTVGLHRNVAGIDFVSMYPGIMVRFNISPEVPRAASDLEPAPGPPGIVPLTLAPLLNKRLALKQSLLNLERHDCRRPLYQALSSAHKWLLVTCFGYLGYKNARFGRIEAHEAVTAYGREALMRAKEAAEDLDYTILHMYVDGLWVSKPGCRTPADFEALLADITARTGLPISLDGIYRWVVFLPSRVNARVPVPNRYFGVFQDGSLKVRGIEARRHDTPPFLLEVQMKILEILAQAEDADGLKETLPLAQAYVRRQLSALRNGRVPLEKLLVAQKLSRELGEYSTPSPVARAVRQLQQAGRDARPGQKVRFLYILGDPGVHAWDLPQRPDPHRLDLARYRTLFQRAVDTVLLPVQQSLQEGQPPGDPTLFPLKGGGAFSRGGLNVPVHRFKPRPSVPVGEPTSLSIQVS